MAFRKIRQYCLQNRILYEDPDFPATEKSVYYSKTDRNIVWRRPGVCSYVTFSFILIYQAIKINLFHNSAFYLFATNSCGYGLYA